jgi:hypothetical protein
MSKDVFVRGVGITLASAVIFFLSAQKVFALPAFPGAEGFGAETAGGRGGKVYEVTNLNDSGSGSLRDCIDATGPRICIFKVGGSIPLSSGLTIKNPYITIAGQTAPGGGITLKPAGSTSGTLINVQTHDVIIRYIASRPGPGGMNNAILIAKNNMPLYNIIVDHSSFSWATDEVFTTWYRVYNTSIQWNIVSEGLDCSTHPKGCHSKGLMIGAYKGGEGETSGKGAEDITVHHNLIANNAERAPLVQQCGVTQIINNVTYNPSWTFSHQQSNCLNFMGYVNWIGNFHKKGPDSTSGTDLKVLTPEEEGYPGGGGTRVYVKGNIGPSRTSDSLPEVNWVDSGSRSYIVTSPAPGPSVTVTDAQTAYNQVLADAGNSKGLSNDGSFYNRRDSIDARIVNDVKNGTGRIIDNPSEVGGWAAIAGGAGYTDTDRDGMANDWEGIKGLNPNDASDGTTDKDGDGYTNLEEFINGSDPGTGTGPTPTPGAKTGDINSDGRVDIVDIGIIIDNYGKSPIPNPKADVNKDGRVDIVDIGIVIDSYGK